MRRVGIGLLVAALLVAVPLGALAAYPDYDFVDIWVGPGTDPGQVRGPIGIFEHINGEVFVTEGTNDRIQVFDLDGMFLRTFGSSGSGPEQLDLPMGLCVTEADEVFVCDYDNDRISVWDTQGNHLMNFGAGVLNGPDDITQGPDGLLYVAEWHDDRISVFETDGTHVDTWGTPGAGDGQLLGPVGVAFDRDGLLWVADAANDRIQAFEPDGTFVKKVGEPGVGEGQFDMPYDVSFDPHGYMYVADFYNDRVQKFAPDGTFVTEFGSSGGGDGEFLRAWYVVPTSERYVLVSDYGNDRIQRWFTAVPTQEQPIDGPTRYETAVKASEEAYPGGLMEDSEGYKTVIVATGANWPDALGGSALAGVLDAPILLVAPDALPVAPATEIERLGATRVIVLGETGAVSSGVATALGAIPGVAEVERIGGADRYVTAEMVAERVVDLQGAEYDANAFVATGADFPDALACSPIAAANGWPLYLAPPAGLPERTTDAMQDDGVAQAHILGGTGAVSASTEAQLNDLLGDANVDRIEGADRYETAVEVAWFGQSQAGMNWVYTALATGGDFPDALTGGPMQARDRSIMLLTRGTGSLEPVVAGAIEDHKNAVWTLRYLGGTGVLSQDVRDEAAGLLY